jgi:hypothetical protein
VQAVLVERIAETGIVVSKLRAKNNTVFLIIGSGHRNLILLSICLLFIRKEFAMASS